MAACLQSERLARDARSRKAAFQSTEHAVNRLDGSPSARSTDRTFQSGSRFSAVHGVTQIIAESFTKNTTMV